MLNVEEFPKFMSEYSPSETKNLQYIYDHNAHFNEDEIPHCYLAHSYPFDEFYPTEIFFKKNNRFASFGEHRHNYVEMSYVYEGTIKETINGKEIELMKGDLLILDTHTKHSIKYTTKNDMMINFGLNENTFNNNFFSVFSNNNLVMSFVLNSLYESKKNQSYLLFKNCNDEIRYFLSKIAVEFVNGTKEKNLIMNNILQLLFIELVRGEHDNLISVSEDPDSYQFRSKLIEYIENNIQAPSLQECAELFDYSVSYFSKLIKSKIGCNWTELLTDIRIQMVKNMLTNSDLTINEIAESVGFENKSFFFRVFKRREELSPSTYRKRYKNTT